MSSPRRLVAVGLALALGAGACARNRARTRPEPPPALLSATPISVPTVAWPPALEPTPVSAWLAEPEPAASERPAESPQRPPEARERRPEPPAPQAPAKTADEARLATPETADAEAATRRVLLTLARARAALDRVRADRLTGDARVQYETARQLIEQASEAVKARNFMYAIRLADKAETLARGLAGEG